MVERRKPLVLSSTKFLIHSICSSRLSEGDQVLVTAEDKLLKDNEPGGFLLRAGILTFSRNNEHILDPKLVSLDNAALVGLSTSALKRLSITSGSLVNKLLSEPLVG